MKLANIFKTGFFFLIMAFIALPAFQGRFDLFSSKPLTGVFESAVRPVFRFSGWWKGDYQENYRSWLEENIGFRTDLVRLFNQADFSLFAISHANKIIAGKENWLFGEQYIRAWTGDDFAGKSYIDRKVWQMKYVQDKLWKDKGIYLMVIFTPDKGNFYPEYIPKRFTVKKKSITNDSYFIKKYAEAGINFIDFSHWFIKMKDTSRFPLYPKLGIHWSSYGALLAADSLIRYLEARLNIKLAHIIIDSIEVSTVMKDEENDISKTMNLIWDISSPPMAYPHFHFISDSSCPKPNVLFIGDSFYWNWYYPGIIRNLFANEAFWYYDKEVYPESNTTSLKTGQLDFFESIAQQKVIIIMQTNAGYGDPGSSFPDRAFSYLYPGPSRIKYYMDQIRNNPGWLEAVRKKAENQKFLLDAMIRIDAIFLANQELKNKK